MLHRRFAGSEHPDDKERDCEIELVNFPILNCIWNQIQSKLPDKYTLVRCYANAYPYGADGTTHKDSNRPWAITAIYYPSLVWNRDWGGETMFFHGQAADGIVEAVYPQPNRLIVFPGTTYHVARGISKSCPDLRMTLMFKAELSKEHFLNGLGADHTGRTLADHLRGTRDILVSWGMPQHICDAGLYHSIYGNNIFTHKSHPIEDRDTICKFIGVIAEELVYKFCTMDRPNALLNNDTNLDDLRTIEAANLLEQGASLERLLEYLPADHPAKQAPAQTAATP
jgi:SM-20-related protein